mgnify:CR=1 FL=1
MVRRYLGPGFWAAAEADIRLQPAPEVSNNGHTDRGLFGLTGIPVQPRIPCAGPGLCSQHSPMQACLLSHSPPPLALWPSFATVWQPQRSRQSCLGSNVTTPASATTDALCCFSDLIRVCSDVWPSTLP